MSDKPGDLIASPTDMEGPGSELFEGSLSPSVPPHGDRSTLRVDRGALSDRPRSFEHIATSSSPRAARDRSGLLVDTPYGQHHAPRFGGLLEDFRPPRTDVPHGNAPVDHPSWSPPSTRLDLTGMYMYRQMPASFYGAAHLPDTPSGASRLERPRSPREVNWAGLTSVVPKGVDYYNCDESDAESSSSSFDGLFEGGNEEDEAGFVAAHPDPDGHNLVPDPEIKARIQAHLALYPTRISPHLVADAPGAHDAPRRRRVLGAAISSAPGCEGMVHPVYASSTDDDAEDDVDSLDDLFGEKEEEEEDDEGERKPDTASTHSSVPASTAADLARSPSPAPPASPEASPTGGSADG